MEDLAALETLHRLTVKFFMTPPSQVSQVFSRDEIAILKAAGIMHKPHGRKYNADDAAVTAAAYSKLSR